MGELIEGWMVGKLIAELVFWALGAGVFYWLCVRRVVLVLRSIDASLRCLPAVRESRAAEYRRRGRAA